MKTRIITSIVGLAVLALVLVFFETPIYNLVLACVSLIAIHEAYEAFQIRCKPVFAAFIPATMWLFLGQELFPGSVMWPVLYGYRSCPHIVFCSRFGNDDADGHDCCLLLFASLSAQLL